MSNLPRESFKFLLSVFEQSGNQATPDLGRLLERTFSDVEPQLLMQAGMEAMKQARGRVTIADVQKQIDLLKPTTAEQHPSAEEAWSCASKSEEDTTYLTDEMSDAINRGDIKSYLEREDYIGGERAFKKLYDENVAKSRAAGKKPVWRVSLGHDRSKRVDGLEKAVSRGIIDSDRASGFDPENQAIYLSAERNYISKLPEEKQKALTGRVKHLQDSILLLAEAKQDAPWMEEEKPSDERMRDPYVIERAASLGLSPYEYLVRPCPPHVAAKVHAQLSKQYGFSLESMTSKKGNGYAATR